MQLIVLGMHRSGTSCVTRLLNMMGARSIALSKRNTPVLGSRSLDIVHVALALSIRANRFFYIRRATVTAGCICRLTGNYAYFSHLGDGIVELGIVSSEFVSEMIKTGIII